MKEFNLEKALAGEKVITREGIEVTDIYEFNCEESHPLIAIINGDIWAFTSLGKRGVTVDSGSDLFMAPKKLSGFVNVFSDGKTGTTHKTRIEASQAFGNNPIVAVIDLSQFDEGHGL